MPVSPYTAKPCGTGCKQVTFGNSVDKGYEVSSDYLVYVGQKGGGYKVYLVDLAKGTEVILQPFSGYHGCSAVATNGQKLAYSCVRDCFMTSTWKRSVTVYDPKSKIETDLTCIERYRKDNTCLPGAIGLGTAGIGLNMSMTSCQLVGAHLYGFSSGAISDVGKQKGGIWHLGMSGKYMIWTQATTAWKDTQIVVYDTVSGSSKRVDSNAGKGQYLARIEGSQIVWTDHRHGPGDMWKPANSDIYHHDLSTGKTTRVTTDPGTQEQPDVWGDWVVWMDWRNSPGGYSRGGKASNCDVYGKNLKTGKEVQLAGGAGHQAYSRVDKDRVFYIGLDSKNESVFMIDLKKRFGP